VGTIVEINDTLKITSEQGMPETIVIGERYKFYLSDERLFNIPPVRVFLVHEINGLWKYIGHAFIVEQTINSDLKSTSGIFEVIHLYDQEYSRLASINESPPGKSFF